MFGPMGSTIISILQVLTPSEIDRYTEGIGIDESSAEGVFKVASGGESFGAFDTSSGNHEGAAFGESTKLNEDDSDKDNEHEAKIIPINSSIKIEKPKVIEKKNPEDIKKENISLRLESLGIESARAIRERKLKEKVKEDAQKDSASVFILDQRELLKASQLKLVSQCGIVEYKKNGEQEILSAKDNTDGEKKITGSSGILIDKKHY